MTTEWYVPEFNFGNYILQVPKYCHGTQSTSLHGFTSWRRSKRWLHLLCTPITWTYTANTVRSYFGMYTSCTHI